jgi:hypothetical protein
MPARNLCGLRKRGLTAATHPCCLFFARASYPERSDTPISLQIGRQTDVGAPMAILLWQENVCCKEKGSLFPNYGRVVLPMKSKMGTGTVLWLRTRTFQQLFTLSFIRMPPPLLRRSYVP